MSRLAPAKSTILKIEMIIHEAIQNQQFTRHEMINEINQIINKYYE